MCFPVAKIRPSSSLIDNGWFENFESAFALGVQFRSNTEGYREHGALGVSDGSAVDDRHIERAEDLRADLGNERAAARGRIALREIAKKYARDLFKNTRLIQVAQCAVNLVGLHSAIFEYENGILGVGIKAGAQRCLQHRQTAAHNTAGSGTRSEGFSVKGNFPFGFRFADGLQKRNQVVAQRAIRSVIETGCDHRPVEAGPATRFSQEQLDDVEIAEADNALGTQKTCGKAKIDKVVGSVAATRGDHAVNILVVDGFAELLKPFVVTCSKVALGLHRRGLFDQKSQTAKFCDTCGHRSGIGRGRWGNDPEA